MTVCSVSNQSVAVGSLCDNIEVDQRTGDVWLGCHPNAMKLFKYNPEDPPGSVVSVFHEMIHQHYYLHFSWYLYLCFLQVILIKNIHSEQPVVSQEYTDNGHEIMGSSVAAPYEGKLLIGTVFHRAMRCDLRWSVLSVITTD